MSGKKYRCGLVVGKFCPPTKGHVHLIEEAAKLCENVEVFIYSNPDPRRMDSFSRSMLLAKSLGTSYIENIVNGARVRFWPLDHTHTPPHNLAPAVEHRKWVQGRWEYLLGKKRPDVVVGAEDYMRKFASHLRTAYVQIARIDDIRARDIRANPYDHLETLPAPVKQFYFNDYVEKVTFMGAESTGKSTLAQMASIMYGGRFVHEYGADLYIERGGNLDSKGHVEIMRGHLEREEQAKRHLLSYNYLWVDTNPLTTLFYSYYLTGTAEKELRDYCNNFGGLQMNYRHFFMLPINIPFDGRNMRGPDGETRKMQHAMNIMMLEQREIDYVMLGSRTIPERLAEVKDILDKRRQEDYNPTGII